MLARSFFIALFLTIFGAVTGLSQTVATKDATATSYLSSAVNALAQGVPISSATVTGTATRTAGSDVETGSITLKALGGGDGAIDLTLSDGSRSEIINNAQGLPQAASSDPDGTWHITPLPNCLTPADWFFPVLALAQVLNDPSFAAAYIGQETRNSGPVQHLRFWRASFPNVTADPGTLASLQRESAVDVYLDAATSAPVAFDFTMHSDGGYGLDIPVEIQFSDYQKLSGILMPSHIEKLINNSPVLDLYVTGVALNTNLSVTDFTVPAS